MYWPIGAPRIYAASGSQDARDRVVFFDDDIEPGETTEGGDSYIDAVGGPLETAHDEEESHSGAHTPLLPTTPGIKPVEHDAQRRFSARTLATIADKLEDAHAKAEKEEILALSISRTGHLFAVITSTSMTVWQTKVNDRSSKLGIR